MARGDYGPEVQGAMNAKPKPPKAKRSKFPPDSAAEKKAEGDTPAEMARDKARGIAEGSPRDEALDMRVMPDMHHVAAAAGIAHAILGNRGMR